MIKRRNYFIDKNFQTRFIFKFSLIVIMSSAIIMGILLILLRNSTTVAIENTEVVVKNTVDFIFPLMLVTLVLVTIFAAISVSILCLFISHKIAGPLYRLKKEIDRFAAGDLAVNFHIRKDDQLMHLADSLEQMAGNLRQNIKILKEKFDHIYPRLKESLTREEIDKIKEIIDSFKV